MAIRCPTAASPRGVFANCDDVPDIFCGRFLPRNRGIFRLDANPRVVSEPCLQLELVFRSFLAYLMRDRRRFQRTRVSDWSRNPPRWRVVPRHSDGLARRRTCILTCGYISILECLGPEIRGKWKAGLQKETSG